ncbi:MAG: ABC transporter permease [Bacteroidota bacterium]
MVRNFFVIAFRHILRNRLFTFINIFGLALGIACVSIIMVYVHFELSYDRFHQSAENIYRVAWFGSGDSPQTRTPHPMAEAMVNDFPEVKAAVSMTPIWGPGLIKETFTVNNPENDVWFEEKEVLAVDSSFFEVFSFELIIGDKESVLKRPDVVLITESIAAKYFGENWRVDNPLGKLLAANTPDDVVEIGGIIKDPPKASHFHFDFLISYERLKAENPDAPFFQWGDFGHFNYVRLEEDTDAEALERKLFEWVAPHINADKETVAYFNARPNAGFQLQRITDIHLHSQIRWELEANGNIAYVYIMSAAALFILIIAAFNFMNLTTAQSANRSKEIGIRKSLGARPKQVRFQFIFETTLLAVVAVLTGGFIAEITLPFFENITGNTLNSELLYSPSFIIAFISIILLLGLLAGLYPAFFLSSLNIRKVLKGEFVSGKNGNTFRRTLVILQFGIAMILITGNLVIFEQLQFIQNKPLGFNKEAKVLLPMMEGAMRDKYPTLEKELLRLPGIKDVAAISNIPGGQFNQNPLYALNQPENRIDAIEMSGSHDYLKLMNVQLVAGRYFNRLALTDTAEAFIINEEAVKSLNLKTPIGAELALERDGEMIKGTVIGVTKNFHYQSLHTPIRPVLVMLRPLYNHLVINMETGQFNDKMKAIKTIWQEYAGNFQFSYHFLDDNITAQYRAENITAKIFSFFSVIAIVIACLGLFSMAAINMARKQKEIGVRKVLGASSFRILFLLISDFSKPIFVALLLAIPLAWWMMDNWLQNFTYHIEIQAQLFILSGFLVILVAWLTISWLLTKTVSTNPVEALKNE